MSNKRNPRRRGQTIRSEASRKPTIVTQSMASRAAALPRERERKARKEELHKLVLERQKKARRERLLERPKKPRKRRRRYGRAFWQHSHDA